jgi:hypothetical protein
VDFQRRGAVERRAREAAVSEAGRADWSVAPPAVVEHDLDAGLLRRLPPDQQRAIAAHVLHRRRYGQIASESATSEASIRQRVSRGLRTLRGPLRVYRAARELARQDRAYRFGGGHGVFLGSIGPREPLDRSSSAGLIFKKAGMFDADPAWTSSRLAHGWGRVGEGRYLTVWANDEHVWLEFRLDADHGDASTRRPHASRPTAAGSPPAPDRHESSLPGTGPDSEALTARAHGLLSLEAAVRPV